MTFKEITDSCNRQLDQDFDNGLYVDWINACLEEIQEEVYLPTRTTVTANVDGSFTLPTNYKEDLRVRIGADTRFSQQVAYDEPTVQGYAIYGETLYVRNRTGVTSVELFYSRFPAQITSSPTDVPDIPDRFHNVIASYCKMQAMLFIEDIAEDERYAFYAAEWQRGIAKMKDFFDKQKASEIPTTTWVVVR